MTPIISEQPLQSLIKESLENVKKDINKGEIISKIIPEEIRNASFNSEKVKQLLVEVKLYLEKQKKEICEDKVDTQLIYHEIADELSSCLSKSEFRDFAWDAQNQKAFPELIIEIAKIAAKQTGRGTSKYIQKYGIKSQKALIEIAKIAAERFGGGTSEFIQNYGIEDPNALIEIAKIAAEQDGGGTSKYIQKYGIKDPNALIEIAKIVAKQSGMRISQYIKNYVIKDEKALIEIAKIAAEQAGSGTSLYIKNYDIKDEKPLIEIAKIAAEQSGRGTSLYIKNYDIKDPNALIEIAKIAAKQDGGGTSCHIKNYGIKSQKARIEIAKIAANQDGRETSGFIRNYGIEDPNALIEIAKIAAEQAGSGTSLYIQKYGIKSQKARIEIAKIAAKQDGEGTSEYIQNYGISDVNQRFVILGVALAESTESLKYVDRYGLPFDISKLRCEYNKMWSEEYFDSLTKEISKQKDQKIKNLLIATMGYILGLSVTEKLTNEQMNWMKPIILSILKYRDPKIRFFLAIKLIELAKGNNSRKFYDEISTDAPIHTVLPNLLLSLYKKQGIEDEVCRSISEIVKQRAFRDIKNKRPLINSSSTLLDQSEVDIQDKKYLLELTFPKQVENQKVKSIIIN